MDKKADVSVEIVSVTKKYGAVTALDDVSLEIRDNEFFTLLGPSGCGKTTLLRIIAGFENITLGSVRLFGNDISDLPPNKRPVNTVFQNYALFPHMDVTANVMYGLQRQKKDSTEVKKRVSEVLDLVQLTEFAHRSPAQLSGGQQQRVALARALAPSPEVLLLDEPLSALDLKLRQAVRLELKQLQQNTGITFIFVTHDQEEALTMSDRIAVISAGALHQVGTPSDIYELPKNRFVAGFVGDTNLIDVDIQSIQDGIGSCVLPDGIKLDCPVAPGAKPGAGHVSIRPEHIRIVNKDSGVLSGVVEHIEYLGTDKHVAIRLGDGENMKVRVQNSREVHIPEVGEHVGLEVEADMARLLID